MTKTKAKKYELPYVGSLSVRDGEGDGDGGDGTDNANVFQFSGKFVEKKDPVTNKPIKIPVELEPVLGHFISTTRSSVESQFKPLLEKIEGENAELKDIRLEHERLKEQFMTAEEKAQENAKKVIQEHQKKAKGFEEDAILWKNRFEKTMVRNDIFSSFGGEKLCNPGQVALLFENEGSAQVVEIIDGDGKPTGRFETRVALTLENDKGESEMMEGTPAELFSKWIKLDRNLHHLQNELPAGSGARPGKNMGGKIDMNLPPVERLNRYREQQAAK